MENNNMNMEKIISITKSIVSPDDSELIIKTKKSYLPNVLYYKYHLETKEDSEFLAIHMANKFAEKYGKPSFKELEFLEKEKWFDILQGFYPISEYDYKSLIFG